MKLNLLDAFGSTISLILSSLALASNHFAPRDDVIDCELHVLQKSLVRWVVLLRNARKKELQTVGAKLAGILNNQRIVHNLFHPIRLTSQLFLERLHNQTVLFL